MATDRPRALVSGASVAGPVLAYWLERFGYAPTVVERTPKFAWAPAGTRSTCSVRPSS